MNYLLVMKIKWSLDINTGAVERSDAARARRLAGATGGNNTLRAGAPRELLPWRRPCPVIPVRGDNRTCTYFRI